MNEAVSPGAGHAAYRFPVPPSVFGSLEVQVVAVELGRGSIYLGNTASLRSR